VDRVLGRVEVIENPKIADAQRAAAVLVTLEQLAFEGLTG